LKSGDFTDLFDANQLDATAAGEPGVMQWMFTYYLVMIWKPQYE
jgi:hypothetical protein